MGIAESVNGFLEAINAVLWHEYVLYIILITGIVFLVWSKFSPLIALTHGVQVVLGKYDKKGDPGAINHFQALSAALSATVGLGNIGGVAIAIALGGPGAVFWMWVVGFVGMAIKTTEVSLSMLYRNTEESNNPHGGPMWVADKGLRSIHPALGKFGKAVGSIFCVTLIISTMTGGNMFQSWNVSKLTSQYFGVPEIVTGVILAILCGLVIIGGIKRIGAVAGRLVPMMLGMYIVASIVVIVMHIGEVPTLLITIVKSAFSPTEAQGAFLGGTFFYAFQWGLKRALFSNEAGQGSAPIAHSAAKTDEPVREGIVAGLEPFIDTIVVCTMTALVILASGAWNRGPEGHFAAVPQVIPTTDGAAWTLQSEGLPTRDSGQWTADQTVFAVVQADMRKESGNNLNRIYGKVSLNANNPQIIWDSITSSQQPSISDRGVYAEYVGATLTAHAFDRVFDGLGQWMVTLAAWLFAISTIISWSYYGEQGTVYLFGQRWVLPYKLIFLALTVVATTGIVSTDRELDNMTGFGTGVMLFAGIPICWIFASRAMNAYHDYVRRLKAGEFKSHAAPKLRDVMSGADVD